MKRKSQKIQIEKLSQEELLKTKGGNQDEMEPVTVTGEGPDPIEPIYSGVQTKSEQTNSAP
ncbi:MAG: hypothetical protein ACOCQD_03000 [archaeon]